MSATDEQHGQLDTGYPHALRYELHKALDVAGVDYWVAQGLTFYNRADGVECVAYGYGVNGERKLAVKMVGFTDPEQVIEATLGRGTCHMEYDFRWWDDDLGWLTSYTCSACGESVILMSDRKPSCCPNCGRRVVEVAS